jgi:hypothetical protein
MATKKQAAIDKPKPTKPADGCQPALSAGEDWAKFFQSLGDNQPPEAGDASI